MVGQVILFQPYVIHCPSCNGWSYTKKWILGKYECAVCGQHVRASISDSLMQIDRDRIETKYKWLRRNGMIPPNQNEVDEVINLIRNEFHAPAMEYKI